MHLKPKIAVLILPIILLQIIVLVIPSFILYQKYFSEQMKEHISDSISQVQNSLQTQLGALEADSLLFSQSAVLNKYIQFEDKNMRSDYMHSEVLDEFSSFMNAHPEYIEISLLTLDGDEKVSLLNDEINNLTDKEQNSFYFQNIAGSVSDFEITPLINPDTEQWTLVLARKVFQQSLIEHSASTPKDVMGYLIVKVGFNFMDNLFKDNSLLDNGFMVIHNSKGAPVIVKGDHKVAASSTFKRFAAMTHSNKLQFTDWSVSDNSYLVGQKQLHNNLFCSIGWPKSELDNLLKNIGYSSLLNSLFVIILSTLILFWILNKLLIKPILQLSLSAQKMGQQRGQWSYQSNSRDELSDLADTIKKMGQGLLEQKQKVHEIAHIDNLTKLPNRRQFTDELESHYCDTEEALPDIALLFIDLDGFKQINDTYGHGIGDHLLVIVAQRLKNILRADDRINFAAGNSALRQHKIARLGGDEFTVLLNGIKERKAAERVAKRILNALSTTITIANREFLISASIGIALAAESGKNAVDLLKNADTAMYEAKVKGKNTYRFFNKSAALKSLKSMEIKEDLRRAINNNELQLAYQPQISTKTGRMVGCEALVRWNQPGKGWISPELFIPIAEQSGLIVSLGRWVLQQACQQIKQWQQMGYSTVPVWVNVSCIQLAREDMHQVIMDCLAETELEPGLLAVEVTESSIIQGTNSIIQLEKIQSEGIRVALDDFGTGYSSLSALRGLPIDKVKIDKSFITDLSNGEDGKAIVSAIIAMAHQLNLQVVAEGIETAEELDFLEQSNADIIQGYYFNKPLLTNEFTEKLQTVTEACVA